MTYNFVGCLSSLINPETLTTEFFERIQLEETVEYLDGRFGRAAQQNWIGIGDRSETTHSSFDIFEIFGESSVLDRIR